MGDIGQICDHGPGEPSISSTIFVGTALLTDNTHSRRFRLLFTTGSWNLEIEMSEVTNRGNPFEDITYGPNWLGSPICVMVTPCY